MLDLEETFNSLPLGMTIVYLNGITKIYYKWKDKTNLIYSCLSISSAVEELSKIVKKEIELNTPKSTEGIHAFKKWLYKEYNVSE